MKLKKMLVVSALTASLVMSSLSGCGAKEPVDDVINEATTMASTEAEPESSQEVQTQAQEIVVDMDTKAAIKERPMLINTVEFSNENATPSVEPYSIEADLSNVTNLWQFYLEDEMAQKIANNGFVVAGDAGREFFEIYEQNRYNMVPNFVTVDSMMHTYHLYFSHLMKNIEKDYLAYNINQLSHKMLDKSTKQYNALKGSEWEDAAKRNVAFFVVGTKLIDGNAQIDADIMTEVADVVAYELSSIDGAAGIATNQITGEMEDYSQYKVRGYYEGDNELEAYFKAMMWYGRIHFKQNNDEMNKSALLMTMALDSDAEAYKLWESVYAVTSFFAGASDDLGVCEYANIMREAYGESAEVASLVDNTSAYTVFKDKIAKLAPPRINSIPINDGEDNVIKGFRFMGQRFTIDATVMQQLIYSNVGANSEGTKRMLPDVLDVPAALGSDVAMDILEEKGATNYTGYVENMDNLRSSLANADDGLWSASLYASWLNTLRPLLDEKGEGYPIFMQNKEWSKKNLECFAGSFTELKHDTVLYSKQVMAEMGGGWEEEPDDRGYVEPEPIVYDRFASLAEMTLQGLKAYDMLSAQDEDNLTRLSELARQLQTISNKELKNKTLSDEEYELIRTYGGNIEHFWYDAVKDEADTDYVAADEFPAAIVVDIATDPNGEVLEIATGDPSRIYVVVNVDGNLKIASGSVYSFYQFTQPIDERLTDSEWRYMMGIQCDEEGNYNWDSKIDQPEWTDSYRYHYE